MLQDFLAKKPKKHLIFDLDDTLLKLHIDWSDFRPSFWELVEGIDKDLADSVPNRSKMGNVLYSKVIQKHGAEARQKLLKFCEQYEQDYFRGIFPNRPLVDFVKENHDNYDFYIWSSNNRRTIERVLRDSALDNFFQKIVAKEDVSLLKPEIDGFTLIFDPKRQSKKDYLMIGDNFLDEGAAQNAGIDFYKVEPDFY